MSSSSRQARPQRRGSPKQRRALSVPSGPGALDTGGDPRIAAQLADALRAAQRDRDTSLSLTHPFHTYPARMHPATARHLVELAVADAPGIILDPFCGSGTTLVEARHTGATAIGADLSPLAVLIARAKTWTPAPARIAQLRRVGLELAAEARNTASAARRAGFEAAPERTARGVDARTRNRELSQWFYPHTRRELEHLGAAIEAVQPAELRPLLEAVLSAILYKVSRRASDTDATRVAKNIARGAPARLFGQRLELLCAGLEDLAQPYPRTAPARVHVRDARTLDARALGGQLADAVITSPPYAGTYDYLEHHRLRMVFLGLPMGDFARHEMGARRKTDRWEADMTRVLANLAAVVRPGGHIALVVGDSFSGQKAVFADQSVAAALPDTLSVVAWASQQRKHMGSRERAAFGDRPKREHIIWIQRAQP